ncbi:MAG: alpha/beta fold hydrolase [Steroidobacteraceae bacterium]|jgi:magnesium chelatase accessory protein|nr:alpha/beta fold hydrolase [Steroidobacteraceae bacterium]
MSLRAPDWHEDGRDWPNREHSRFVEAAGLRWHVQVMGTGPTMLLVHGTGAATHSWRDLAPRLARRYTVVAPDLPGHGFTAAAPERQMSMPGMAQALQALLRALALVPEWVVGHSAGAAILARGCLDEGWRPRGFFSLNGALLPLGGLRHPGIAPFARAFVTGSLVPRLFAWRAADPAVTARILGETGSRLEPRGVELYRRLASRPAHVSAALTMMAMWDPRPLARDLPRLAVPLCLLAGGSDGMIPAREAEKVRALVPGAELLPLPGLGHLAHEEAPDRIAALLAERAVVAAPAPIPP